MFSCILNVFLQPQNAIFSTSIISPHHLHRVCEDNTIETNEIVVVQGMHGINLPYEVI